LAQTRQNISSDKGFACIDFSMADSRIFSLRGGSTTIRDNLTSLWRTYPILGQPLTPPAMSCFGCAERSRRATMNEKTTYRPARSTERVG